MQKKNYLPRLIDTTVTDYLSAFGAVVIEGPNGVERLGLPPNIATVSFF